MCSTSSHSSHSLSTLSFPPCTFPILLFHSEVITTSLSQHASIMSLYPLTTSLSLPPSLPPFLSPSLPLSLPLSLSFFLPLSLPPSLSPFLPLPNFLLLHSLILTVNIEHHLPHWGSDTLVESKPHLPTITQHVWVSLRLGKEWPTYRSISEERKKVIEETGKEERMSKYIFKRN